MTSSGSEIKGDILVVDDTPANLRLLSGMLTEQHYKVRPAPNGESAIRAANAAPPDLIMLDINMPGIDGYEVCQILKETVATKDIPVLFISALDEPLDKVRAFQAGGADYITKPFQFEEVLARVETHLERRRAEEKLKHYTSELEARNEELDAFAATVAHDLKNPLAAISGMAELIKTLYEETLDEQANDFLARILSNTKKMNEIIDALLLLARIRDQKPENTTISMMGIIEKVLDRMSYQITKSRTSIRLSNSWPEVTGYSPWVEEVWVNYLSNAIKYGGKPPIVELGAGKPENGQVKFWIKDYGKGISSENQSKLFSPFTRLEEGVIEGHGLGLSIVKRIIEKLGGKVGLKSNPGEGSTFWFTLPLK